MIDAAPVLGAEKASDLLAAARTSNRRYKKIEVFEEAMQKAERAGGDVVKKYRTATRNILNSKSQRAKFDTPEIAVNGGNLLKEEYQKRCLALQAILRLAEQDMVRF